MIVNHAAELSQLPDGTIITWLRIPGDPTSEAVAFVRHQDEANNDPDGRPLDPPFTRTTWISPGGWDPQTVESAGVRFPAVAFLDPSQSPAAAITLDQGGTWSREAALNAAVRMFERHAMVPGYSTQEFADIVTDTAELFERWLDRPTDAAADDAPSWFDFSLTDPPKEPRR